MTHWDSDLHYLIHIPDDLGVRKYWFAGINTHLRLNYSSTFNYAYIRVSKGQRHTSELLVCIKPNGDIMVRLEKQNQYFLRFLIHGQQYMLKWCRYNNSLLDKHQFDGTKECLAVFFPFYTPPIHASWHCIQMKDWVYTYSLHSYFHALVAGVHWKNLTRRKIWLRKYKKFCNQTLFYPYFWKNLVNYLY